MLAEELAQRFGVPVECSPHLEAGVGGARGKLRAPAGAWAHQVGGDVLLAAVGEDEGFYHVQVATGVDDADQQRIVAILRDLWTGKAVLPDQEPEPPGCFSHEGLAADVHLSRMPQAVRVRRASAQYLGTTLHRLAVAEFPVRGRPRLEAGCMGGIRQVYDVAGHQA